MYIAPSLLVGLKWNKLPYLISQRYCNAGVCMCVCACVFFVSVCAKLVCVYMSASIYNTMSFVNYRYETLYGDSRVWYLHC